MDRKVTLVWIYMGKDPAGRLEAIGGIDGSHLEILAVGNEQVQKAAELYDVSRAHTSMKTLDSVSLGTIWNAASPQSESLVFWMDDGKLVNSTFPLDMAAPLAGADVEARAGAQHAVRDRHLHYWDGNALAVTRSLAESLALEDMTLRDDCLLILFSDVVDRDTQLGESQLKVMFSPLERFAAIEAQPLGLTS
jgi:hypothetical protein